MAAVPAAENIARSSVRTATSTCAKTDTPHPGQIRLNAPPILKDQGGVLNVLRAGGAGQPGGGMWPSIPAHLSVMALTRRSAPGSQRSR